MEQTLGKKGDLGAIAVGVVIFFMICSIGYLLMLYVRSTLGSLGTLTSEDNESLYEFVGQLLGLYTMFVLVGLVVMGGIAIYALRTFTGGGRGG